MLPASKKKVSTEAKLNKQEDNGLFTHKECSVADLKEKLLQLTMQTERSLSTRYQQVTRLLKEIAQYQRMLVARHQRITQLGQEVTDRNSRIINVELEDALMISQAIEGHEHEIKEKGNILMAKL